MNTKKKPSQKELILAHLKKAKKKGLTVFEAYERYGITCPHKRIQELEEDGYKILHTPEKIKTRYGKTTIITRYTLSA